MAGKVSRLHLSTSGRAVANATYSTSKLLYKAEFAGLPHDVTTRLLGIAKQLVDRGDDPTVPPPRPRLPGIHSRLLSGQPSKGGFGMLAWDQHVTARHLMWAVYLLHHLAA